MLYLLNRKVVKNNENEVYRALALWKNDRHLNRIQPLDSSLPLEDFILDDSC